MKIFVAGGNGNGRSSADRGIACQRTRSLVALPVFQKRSDFSGSRHRTTTAVDLG